MSHDENTHVQRIARLRAAVDWLETHPEAEGRLEQDHDGNVRFFDTTPSTPSELAQTVRRLGGRWDKEVGSTGLFTLRREVAPGITYELVAWQNEVCTRVVTGTVEREVIEPAPEAVAKLPTRARTVVEEQVEWHCPESLLAGREAA